MSNWKTVLHHMAVDVESRFDELKLELGRRLGGHGRVQLLPYRGYGTTEKVYLKGRVLEHPGGLKAARNNEIWENLLHTYRRFESDEIPGVHLRLELNGATKEVITGKEGYFKAVLNPPGPLPEDQLWHKITAVLDDQVGEEKLTASATGEVLVPSPRSRLGIISDIDDTVLQTDATNLARMAQLTFLRNAHTRLPFEGVAALYQALQEGAAGQPDNPIFYVSSSPWNLYDLLTDFMALEGIPKGPLFLTDLGLDKTKVVKPGHLKHKTRCIEHLLETYPTLPFVLIGDNGQKDPKIYQRVVQEFPNRIQAVYIRDVKLQKKQPAEEVVHKTVGPTEVPMLLVPDSLAAARHAAAHGLIDPARLPDIQTEKDKDHRAPGELEQLVMGPG